MVTGTLVLKFYGYRDIIYDLFLCREYYLKMDVGQED
jgi:hypothetical protein